MNRAAELQEAAQQVGLDLGVWQNGRVPNWMREIGFHLHGMGWRRREHLDPRDQKERWFLTMRADLLDESGKDRVSGLHVRWIDMMALRLVEAGWVKDDRTWGE